MFDEEKNEFSLYFKKVKPDKCLLKKMQKKRFCMNCYT